jgi:hypothetical protein
MDDLVKRIDAEIERQRQTRGIYLAYGTPDPLLVEARARIQALETSLEEAEGRVIAEVVAWLRAKSQHGEDLDHAAYAFAADALENGEWKK